MKRTQTKLLALCISTGLCSAVLAGCGTNSTDPATETQVSAETPEPAQTETVVSDMETATEIQKDAQDAAGIFVEPIEGISDNFIRGMDASSVLVEEKSGVKYYNFEGQEQDVFKTLAEGGVNYIRLRVWNDPYDENGNGYGGGNNDLPTAIELR
ncbi:MAG: glycosyl hydrolase 53 family protein, partial [Lachnospiraceae bacterium]|nr:glycosyl hydrolase 53 family protein [Lachnospiraceae bacterium]